MTGEGLANTILAHLHQLPLDCHAWSYKVTMERLLQVVCSTVYKLLFTGSCPLLHMYTVLVTV